MHFTEPFASCFVKQGVASGLISSDRYESYLRIMSDVLNVKDYSEILKVIRSDVIKNQRDGAGK